MTWRWSGSDEIRNVRGVSITSEHQGDNFTYNWMNNTVQLDSTVPHATHKLTNHDLSEANIKSDHLLLDLLLCVV